MKFLAQIILVILFIPLFLVGLLSTTVRFQLLNTPFWLTTFEKNNVYDNLAKVLKTGIENQTAKEGGSKSDAAFVTNLITPENLKDITEKNLTNLLGFINGKAKDLIVYIPVSKIPKGLLPKNLGPISEETPIETLLTKFNIRGIQASQIQKFSNFGTWSWEIWLLNMILIALVSYGLFRLVTDGARFIGPAVAFLLAGVLTLTLFVFGFVIRGSMLTDWVKSSEPIQNILAPFAPYIFGEILKVWFFAGIALLALGVVLFLLKKR